VLTDITKLDLPCSRTQADKTLRGHKSQRRSSAPHDDPGAQSYPASSLSLILVLPQS
jgi:hypothetical protein